MKTSIKHLESCRTISDNALNLEKDALNFPEFKGSAKQLRRRYAA